MGRRLIPDLRYAVRRLLRTPGFSLAAILTLALGIGACTAAYSLARGLLWRPLPFLEPDRIVVVHGANPARGVSDAELSYADLRDLREQVRGVTLAAMAQRQAAIGAPDGADRVVGWAADPALFQVLGVSAAVGRTFRAGEGASGAAPAVILSHPFWTRRFGRDSSIVGQTVPVNGVAHTVIGVMPAEFQLVRGDVWLPLIPDPTESRDERHFIAVGRLAPGVDAGSARAELATAATALAATHPATNRGWGIELNRYRDDVVDPGSRRALVLMLASVAVVLLIACANVAGLLLARGAASARELAVRAAIGASRIRLVRQALVESSVLALVGGALGVGLATWSNDLLLATLPIEDLPPWLQYSIDGPTLAVTAAVVLSSVLLFGLLPALRASRPSVTDTLKGSSGAPAGTTARSVLVVAQVGLAVVLLASAALFGQSFMATRRGNLGYDDRGVLSARVFFGALPRPTRAAWMRDALAQVRAVPGVGSAALTGAIPGDDGGDHRALAIAGSGVAQGDEPIVTVVPSSDAFLEVLGIAPSEGRWFTAAEAVDSNASIAVVGAGLARSAWPGASPIGQRVRALPDTTWLTVVGVIADLQYEEFGEDGVADRLQIHVPYAREPWRSAALMVRGSADASGLVEPVRRTVRAVHADVPAFDVMTMSETRGYTTAGDRVWMLIFVALGVQALLMTAIGLYGLLSFSVAQRTREIGVRVALGAAPGSVVRLIVSRALVLTGVGLALGLAVAAMTTRAMRGLLWGVDGTLAPLGGVALLLLATTLVAAFVPARRAAAVDPMIALRAE